MIWNESGGKKAISNFTVHLIFLLIFHFSFNWKQYIISAVLYSLSVITIMMGLGVLTKKYGGRIITFIRDVWISYLEQQQQQQWNDTTTYDTICNSYYFVLSPQKMLKKI